MVATNTLLTIAFSVITNFTAVVPIPPDCAPTSLVDFQHYLVGSPYSPVDIHLTGPGRTQFGVSDGIVYHFDSHRSVFREQDPSRLSKYAGPALLTPDQALLLASNTLRLLLKTNATLNKGTPRVKQAGLYEGRRLPFFSVEWPPPSQGPYGATVEIDGRNGHVVYLHLWDPAFRDFPLSARIEKQVFIPEPISKPALEEALDPVKKWNLAQPTTNYVARAIGNWLSFCGKLGLDPGEQTNVADVNWRRTWLYTNKLVSATSAVCQVRFKNSACFESVNGICFSHYCSDACLSTGWQERSAEGWRRFEGMIVQDWRVMAKTLELALTEKLGLPRDVLAPYSPHPGRPPPEVGSQALKRLGLQWRNWPVHPGRTVWVSETKLGFAAEADLETGEFKFVSLLHEDPKLVWALARAQAAALDEPRPSTAAPKLEADDTLP